MNSLENIKKRFSKGFENFLNRNGYKVLGIADMFGMKQPSVSCWKTGRSLPDFDKVVHLLEMGMTVQEMFGDELGKKIINNSLLSQGVSDIPEEKLKLLQDNMHSLNKDTLWRLREIEGMQKYSLELMHRMIALPNNGLDSSQKAELYEELQKQRDDLEKLSKDK